MNLTLKALSVLLAYPTEDLRNDLADLAAALDESGRLRETNRAALGALITELSQGDALDLEERYVGLFDRGRRTSLNLFEHVHGESRERGPAMVDLKRLYQSAGFQMSTRELPDYLPALLEFLSLRPEAEARSTLIDCAHILREIGEALLDRDSRYSAVFAALLAWVGEAGLRAEKNRPRVQEKSIDEEWIDAEVVFGPGAAPSCGSAGRPRSAVMQFMPRAR